MNDKSAADALTQENSLNENWLTLSLLMHKVADFYLIIIPIFAAIH